MNLQKKIEEKALSILEDIDNEFELNSNTFPEIYYIHPKLDYCFLGMSEKHEDLYDYLVRSKGGAYFPKEKVLLLATKKEEEIAEEMTHYLHLSNIENTQEGIISDFSVGALTEMLGFFVSKLFNPARKNYYQKLGDMFEGKNLYEMFEVIGEEYSKGYDAKERLIHSQGYFMGEKLYLEYISGDIDKKEIRSLFKKPLSGKIKAYLEFLDWREDLLKN
jgi:hypothetical protein